MRIHPTQSLLLRRQARRAFTLVELLLVLVILGTLAALVLPRFTNISGRSKITAAQTQISSLKTAISTFEVDNGTFPASLEELVVRPSNATSWHGPYMERVPLDPWQNPFNYEMPGTHDASGYDLSSAGPDGQPGNEDDVTSWQPVNNNTAAGGN